MDPSPATRIRAAHSALFADGNLDAIGEFFAPDYVAHVTGRDMKGGHDFLRKFLGRLHSAFPDLEAEVGILVEAGDRVAWQRTMKGTHKRAYVGFPASGGPLIWRDVVTSRFRDGLIVEEWSISDLAERLLLARKR